MYVLLRDNIASEFIPKFNPLLPGVPIEKRYPKEFVDSLVLVMDEADVMQGYVYDPETGGFSEPPMEEYVEIPYSPEEEAEYEPTEMEVLRADVDFLLVMGGYAE